MSLTEELWATDPLDRNPEFAEPVEYRNERLQGCAVIGDHPQLRMLRIRDRIGAEYYVPWSALPGCVLTAALAPLGPAGGERGNVTAVEEMNR
jgi:hypothetical protein